MSNAFSDYRGGPKGNAHPHFVEPLLVDVNTACTLLSVGRTKLFSLLKQQDGGLQRIKIGSKTLIPIQSIRSLIEKGVQ